MSNLSQLADLASKAAKPWHGWGDRSLPERSGERAWGEDVIGYLGGSWGDFCAAANPWAVLRVLAEYEALTARLAAVEKLAVEHAQTVTPAPYTSERALIEHAAESLDQDYPPALSARGRNESDDLAEAAAWIAESIGYPVECKMPDHRMRMPDALWEALVDHVHVDETGRWHGNELDRDHVESWLADEAGRNLTSWAADAIKDEEVDE